APMCGILLTLQRSSQPQLPASHLASLRAAVSRRGPDHCGVHAFSVPSEHGGDGFSGEIFASVLHLRGPVTVPQPYVRAEDGSWMAFNGEIFEDELDGVERKAFKLPDPASNDAQALFDTLFSPSHPTPPPTAIASTRQGFRRRLLSTLSTLRGPWALAVHHAPSRTIWFGRDSVGRRSLVWNRPYFDLSSAASDSGSERIPCRLPVVVSSVLSEDAEDAGEGGVAEALAAGWEEVPAAGVFEIKMGPDAESRTLPADPNFPIPTTPDGVIPPPRPETIPDLLTFQDSLSAAVRARVQRIPDHNVPAHPGSLPPAPLAILFSGGLDCMVLAALAAVHLPPDAPIDLLNVAFENPRVNKARAAGGSAKKTKKKNQQQQQRGTELPAGGADTTHVDASPSTGDPERADMEPQAADLYDVPDRDTGRLGVAELRKRFPDRPWRLVEVDVPMEEVRVWRGRIKSLMAPLDTVMDLSIAMAFWFAARGKGTVVLDDGTRVNYTSTARVLLSGLGADEQLGGYSRHRTRFQAEGWIGLLDELQLDVSRISSRNLGRDDRIVSDHGKEVRFPYLSERVITCLSSIPVHHKLDPRLPRAIGDKLLLRQLAAMTPSWVHSVSGEHGISDQWVALNLVRASAEAKRAVQFGARTAKMEDRKERGGDVLKQ
ncbi:Asparagine synthetase domain-containing protein 1, partial [Phlyctochytrium bullatum]